MLNEGRRTSQRRILARGRSRALQFQRFHEALRNCVAITCFLKLAVELPYKSILSQPRKATRLE